MTDSQSDPDRRAWHRAEAAAAADEEIATDLERSAERVHAAAMEQLFRIFPEAEAQSLQHAVQGHSVPCHGPGAEKIRVSGVLTPLQGIRIVPILKEAGNEIPLR